MTTTTTVSFISPGSSQFLPGLRCAHVLFEAALEKILDLGHFKVHLLSRTESAGCRDIPSSVGLTTQELTARTTDREWSVSCILRVNSANCQQIVSSD
jgi:hypothetical protein